MKTHGELVFEFMIKHGQVPPVPVEFLTIGPLDPLTSMLRLRLISEEFAELCIAIHQQDIVEAADAMADLWYVSIGTAIAYLGDIPGTGNTARAFFDQPALELAWPTGTASLPIMIEYLDQLGRACFKLWANGPSYLVFVESSLTLLSHKLQIPFDKVFREVHRSNMTKSTLNKHAKGGKVDKAGFEPPNIMKAVSGK